MSIRETLNRNPVISLSVAAGVIVLSLALIIGHFACGGRPAATKPHKQYWYTTDDGANLFPDSRDKVPPFKTESGATAVRARVFKCSGSDKQVAWLEQFPPDVKKRLDSAKSARRMPEEDDMVEVRKPGQKKWVASTDSSAWRDIMKPQQCADGKYWQEVFPD